MPTEQQRRSAIRQASRLVHFAEQQRSGVYGFIRPMGRRIKKELVNRRIITHMKRQPPMDTGDQGFAGK